MLFFKKNVILRIFKFCKFIIFRQKNDCLLTFNGKDGGTDIERS